MGNSPLVSEVAWAQASKPENSKRKAKVAEAKA